MFFFKVTLRTKTTTFVHFRTVHRKQSKQHLNRENDSIWLVIIDEKYYQSSKDLEIDIYIYFFFSHHLFVIFDLLFVDYGLIDHYKDSDNFRRPKGVSKV